MRNLNEETVKQKSVSGQLVYFSDGSEKQKSETVAHLKKKML